MKTDMNLLYSGSNISAKEISFIKSDSETVSHSYYNPEVYFSDYFIAVDIDPEDQWRTNFDLFVRELAAKHDAAAENRESEEESVEDNHSSSVFTCVTMRLTCADKLCRDEGACHDRQECIEPDSGALIGEKAPCHGKSAMETLVHALNVAVSDNSGIWQWLSGSSLIIAIWREREEVEESLKDLMKLMESTLEIPSRAGLAVFPFMNYSVENTALNSVKALDHASFFETGAVVLFDDVSQNIYGDRLYHFGKLEDAAVEYEKGLEIRSENQNLLNSLGVCYSLMNRLESARDQFLKAIALLKAAKERASEPGSGSGSVTSSSRPDSEKRIDPDLTALHPEMISADVEANEFMLFYNAALISDLLEDIDSGIRYITMAASINREFFEAELTAGILFLKAGRSDESMEHLSRAIELNPLSGMAHRALGDLYMQAEKLTDAAREYAHSIKLNPYDSVSMSALARVYEVLGRNLGIALSLALQSLAISPDNPWFRARLARIYRKKGKYDAAELEFSRAGKQFKNIALKRRCSIYDVPLLSEREKSENFDDIRWEGDVADNQMDSPPGNEESIHLLKKKSA